VQFGYPILPEINTLSNFAQKKKYEQGVGSSFEILQADTEFQQAQSNYFKALYDAIIAKISYQKSLGKL